jgi:hypothetical protein
MMFDDLVAKNNIYLPENDIRFIKALITGNPGGCSCVYRFFAHSVFFTSRDIFQGEQPSRKTVFIRNRCKPAEWY